MKLCLVTTIDHLHHMPTYEDFLKEAVRGGVTMVQYRNKSQDRVAVRRGALEVQRILRPLGVTYIINDHVSLAAEIGADGVHVGQSDMRVLEVRQILGPDKIIGLSIEDLKELEEINGLKGHYYAAASTVFGSNTKKDYNKIWGIYGLAQVVANSKHPVMAIGGVTVHNAGDMMAAGALGVAVVGAIHNASNPYTVARELRNAMEETE